MKNIYCFTFLLIFTLSCLAQERGVIVQKNNSAEAATGNTYAIIVGISDYPYLQPLRFADKDAELFRDFLLSPAGGNVRSENMHVLLNENATSANFWVKGFAWLRNKNLQKGDRIYFYFAGHGDAINKDEYFFLPYDCSPSGDKNNYLATGTIQIYNLKVRIADLSSKGVDVMLIMDACRSNELPGGSEGQKILGEAIAEKRSGETMMLAAGSGQESLEDRSIGNGHGLFTWYLIDGLSGNADADAENGNQDKKVDLEEIESWVKRNVKKVAMQKFNHVQVPYFCCTGTQKTVAKVDSVFYKNWIAATKINADAGQNLFAVSKQVSPRGTTGAEPDSNVIKLYNRFNRSVKDNKLMGDSAAEYWYNKMLAQFPKNNYTQEARYTLTSELINFSQEKINLYLTGNDYRFQVVDDSSSKRFLFEQKLKAVANEPFYKVANMLEKGMELAKQFDTTIEKKYLAKLYFLKARGELNDIEAMTTPRMKEIEELKGKLKEKNKGYYRTDMKEALHYAYEALKIDSNAAYIYHLLAKFQYCKDWVVYYDHEGLGLGDQGLNDVGVPDSVVYYEKKATTLAPNWFYAYYYWGNFYSKPAVWFAYDSSLYGKYKDDRYTDSAWILLKKCADMNPEYIPVYPRLANLLNRKNDLTGSINLLKQAQLIAPEHYYLKNELMKYYFKLNIDSGMSYLKKNSEYVFFDAFSQLAHYFINKNDLPMSVFIIKEQLGNRYASSSWCNLSPGYALSKGYDNIADTLLKIIYNTKDPFIIGCTLDDYAVAQQQKKEYKKAIELFKESIQLMPGFPTVKLHLAECYAHDNNKEMALYYLDKALEDGPTSYVKSIEQNTAFDLIRDTKEFKAIIKKYFPDEAK